MTTIHQHSDDYEQVLPSEVSASSSIWLLKARNYPVFSKTWFRYRARAWLLIAAIIMLPVVVTGILYQADWRGFVVVSTNILVSCFAVLFIGPALAVWVRRKSWAARKEMTVLIVVILLGNLTAYGISNTVEYPLKWLVYGDTKSHGHMRFQFGGSVSDDSENTSADDTTNVAKDEASAEKKKVDAEIKQEKLEQTERLEHPFRYYFMKSINGTVQFSLFFFFGGGLDLIIFYRQRHRLLEATRQTELKEAQSARNEAELRLSVLAAQIEPHFLFNSLAGVRSAIQTEPDRATAIVDHLVDYLRATIPQIRHDGKSNQAVLQTQLEAARSYLGLMQARIPRLSYQIAMEDGLANAQLPPLMVISLVENAVKHGIEPKIGPAHICVSAVMLKHAVSNYLQVTVSDDGVGFGLATSGSGIGLANIRERLHAMYGDQASLTLKAQPDGGVAATIQLPLTTS